MLLVEVRDGVEALVEERARLWAEALSGRSNGLDLPALYGRNRALVDDEPFVQVREAAEKSEGRRKQRLSVLAAGLFHLRWEAAASRAVAERNTLLLQRIPGVDPGEQLTLRGAEGKIAREQDRDARAALELRLAHALTPVTSLLGHVLEAGHTTAQRAGFSSLLEARTQLTGIDEAQLAGDAEAFLSATEGMFHDVLSWWLRRTSGMRPFPHGAEHHDVLHALAALPFDGLFPRGDLKRPLAGRLLSMGLDPFAHGRIRVDSEVRPGKSDRAFALPVKVPGEVHLVYRPRGGAHDSRGYLFALGQAQHLAGTEEERPFEDRWLGDQSVPWAVGVLFGGWLLDKRWLKRALDAEAPDLVRVLALRELGEARSEAAAFLAERLLATDGVSAGNVERAAETLSRALLGRVPATIALREIDGFGQLSTALRGRALAAALTPQLLERFDEDWWQNPRSGAFLAGLFAQGQFESGAQLAERLALGELSLGRAARSFEQLFA